jgi:hypothetical protein
MKINYRSQYPTKETHMRLKAISALIALLSLPVSVSASEKWRASGVEDFSKGELESIVLTSNGELRLGTEALATTLPADAEASLLWSSLEVGDAVYFGTGNKGALLKYSAGKLTTVAKTDAMILTALADAGSGAIYAGSTPDGKIYKIDAKGTLSTFSDLEAQHIWALLPVGNTLYAATGPSGALYAIDSAGKAKIVYDSEEDHIMSLAKANDGSILAGTVKSGLLLRITTDGKATAIWDFDGSEVRSILTKGDDTFVAVNTVTTTDTGNPKDNKKGGAVYRVSKDGRVEPIYENKDTYFSATDAGLYAAGGSDGKIYLIDPMKRSTQVAFDVTERQVLTLSLAGKSPVFGCGDAANVYRVSTGAPKKASYLSKVIDAKYIANFGKLYFTGQGKLSFKTRSGNTTDPDATWSDWSAPQTTSGGLISSPAGRYLQIRFDWGSDTTATLSRIDAYYEAQNQRPILTSLYADGEADSTGKRKLSWKTENPDSDTLYANLWYKAEGESNWKPLNDGKRLEGKTEYTWETSNIADGYYQVKVQVSDAGSKPPTTALSSELSSGVFLVDNSRPIFSADIKIDAKKISGTIEDSFSPIKKIDYSVDGGEWILVGAGDGIFDDRREGLSFSIDLPLLPGTHTLVLRAEDSAGNTGLTKKQFEVK